MVVDRWGGPANFDLTNPAQFTTTTLPFAAMIAANNGALRPRCESLRQRSLPTRICQEH
jgi:hypothetical protein